MLNPPLNLLLTQPTPTLRSGTARGDPIQGYRDLLELIS